MGPNCEYNTPLLDKDDANVSVAISSKFSFEKACKQNDAQCLNTFIKKNVSFIKENLDWVVNTAINYNNRYALVLLNKHLYFNDSTQQDLCAFLLSAIKPEQFDCFNLLLAYLINGEQDQVNEHEAYLLPDSLVVKFTELVFSLIKENNIRALELLKDLEYFQFCTRTTLEEFLALTSRSNKSDCFDVFLDYLIKRDPNFIVDRLKWFIVLAIKCGSVAALKLLKNNNFFNHCSKRDIVDFLDLAEQNHIECVSFLLENFDCIEEFREKNFSKEENINNIEKQKANSNKSKKSRSLSEIFSPEKLSNFLKFSTPNSETYRMSLRMPKFTTEKEEENVETDIIDSPESVPSLVLDCDMNCEDLISASKNGCETHVKHFIQIGEDPNVADREGNTPLMRAALGINYECIRSLLEAKPDALEVNNMGKSALYILATMDEKILYRKIKKICLKNLNENLSDRSLYLKSQIKRKIEPNKPEPTLSEKNNALLYTYLFDEMRSITESDPCPLTTLSQNLESLQQKIKHPRLKKMSEFFKSLIQHEANNIYKCCSAILEYNTSEHKINTLEYIKKHNHENVILLAEENNNSGALRAFKPYASRQDQQQLLKWAIENNNKAIKRTCSS